MNTHIHHFLKSLIQLTQERDSFELELALLEAIESLVISLTDAPVHSIKLFRLRDISKRFLMTLEESPIDQNQNADWTEISHAVCEKLMLCYNEGEYQSQDLDEQHAIHIFPLKNKISYQNAVLEITCIKLDVASISALCELLDIYQNYVDLMHDNERDTLTGLLNRKTFDLKFNKIIARFPEMQNQSRSHPQVYYLAILDIDHFKHVNDVHGHLIGDEVLLTFSQLMGEAFRESDLLFRFGGEEFVVIFACNEDYGIKVALDRFARLLKNFHFPQVGKVTVSIGCTQVYPDSVSTSVLEHADLALYYAKENGRNRICYYEELLESGEIVNTDKQGDIELFN